MLYKTITLERLQASPTHYRQLRRERMLLTTLDRLAGDLKAAHESWKKQLRETAPSLDPITRANMAGELALAAWEQQFVLRDSPPESSEDATALPSDG